jgi:hypothetical protein
MTIEEAGPLEPAVEVAILADAVQAAGGKLFVLGGGWDTLVVPRFPARHSLGIGVKIRVPWSDIGGQIRLSVELQDEDGRRVPSAGRLTHSFQAGRPGSHPDGSDVSVVRAITFSNVPLPEPGGYAFAIFLDEVERARLRFRAVTRRTNA